MIEVFGIPEEVRRCYGCRQVRKMLDELGFEYVFYPVMSLDENNQVQIDRDQIEWLARRLGQKSLNIAYPVIYIDNVRQPSMASLKDSLRARNADEIILGDY